MGQLVERFFFDSCDVQSTKVTGTLNVTKHFYILRALPAVTGKTHSKVVSGVYTTPQPLAANDIGRPASLRKGGSKNSPKSGRLIVRCSWLASLERPLEGQLSLPSLRTR